MATRARGIDFDEVPWPLFAYVALSVVSGILLLTRVPSVKFAIMALVLIAAWDYFLLCRVRWLWLATVALFAINIVIDLVLRTGTWWGSGIGAVQLCLLLLPATRQFFESGAT